ncbi:PadR family transcriptional regulator [Patescibacteria group bacterium]|nr:PadR family transcriptional regulator [Patescibacteria group bacterium]
MSQQDSDKAEFKKHSSPLKRGLLEFIILKAIDAESMYADQLCRFLAKTAFSCPPGTLYPLLRKLTKSGYIVHHSDDARKISHAHIQAMRDRYQ